MQQANRTKLCKLQGNPRGKTIYILYTNRMEDFKQRSQIIDFAGLFETEHDANQVADCLNNIFSKLNDNHWRLSGGYIVTPYIETDGIFEQDEEGLDEQGEKKYCVRGMFQAKGGFSKLKQYKSETVLDISKSLKTLENIKKYKTEWYKTNVSGGHKYEFKIIQYRTNDILPTMYFDDYYMTYHHEKFKHVMSELSDFPHAQKTRQNLRRLNRENPGILYSDSSDSEDDTKYKRVTKRSLLHTPTRTKKFTKKISTRR